MAGQSPPANLQCQKGKLCAAACATYAMSLELARKAGYTFPLLSDPSTNVIRSYDLAHEGAGIGGQAVARPAELLVDRNGTVVWRNLSEDYRVRARADTMLERARDMVESGK